MIDRVTAIAGPWAGLNTVGCDEGSEPQRARETLGFAYPKLRHFRRSLRTGQRPGRAGGRNVKPIVGRAVAINMIYTLNIKCVGGAYLEEPFERTIEVSDEMTLGTLHDTIQELTGFDNDHLFTFFMARGPRGQRTSIVETGQWEEEQDRLYEMPLSEVFPLEQNMKLFYWFDFGDDWMFRIQQRRQPKPEDSGTEYPKVIREVGPQPVQYP